MKKVFVIDKTFPSYAAMESRLTELGAELVFAEDKSEEVLIAGCANADAVMCTFTKVTAAMIEKMEHCSMIVRTGLGVDNIDVDAATKKGIQVSYVPDYCRDEVADHTVALVLDATRKISFFNKYVKDEWDLKKKAGFIPRLQDCKLGILSFGGIARKVAQRMLAFDMKVCAYDPYLTDDVFAQMCVERKATTDELFADSDILVLVGPLTPENFHIVNTESIAKMKENVFIVNTARGPLIDEKALIEAVKDKRIGGAALDVLEKEPGENPEIYDYDNVIVTPHVAFFSMESLPDLQRKAEAEVYRALQGEALNNCFNRAALNG